MKVLTTKFISHVAYIFKHILPQFVQSTDILVIQMRIRACLERHDFLNMNHSLFG